MRFFSLKTSFFQPILSATSVIILSSSILFGTTCDWFLLSSAHLPSINLVSVYHSPCPILCKAVITSLEPVFLYIFSDNNIGERDGFAFGIKGSISSQISETLVALTLDNFTMPFSSKVKLEVTIDAVRFNKVLLLALMFFSYSMSCAVGGHWRFSLDSLESCISALTTFLQFLTSNDFFMPTPCKTVDRQLGKTDSSADITNSDVLLVEDWLDFINFSLSSNFPLVYFSSQYYVT